MFYTLIYKLLVIYSYPLQLTSTRYCKYSYVLLMMGEDTTRNM